MTPKSIEYEIEPGAVVWISDLDHPFGPLGGVYFIQVEGFVKIGYSGHVKRRFFAVLNNSPFRPVPLGFMPCASARAALALEAELHARFRAEREHGEWYRLTPALIAFICEHAQAWPPRTGRHPK